LRVLKSFPTDWSGSKRAVFKISQSFAGCRDYLRSTKRGGLWTGEDLKTRHIKRTYELLAKSPAAIIAVTLEEALAVQERPNMPGAPACPWSLALPVQLEDIQYPLAKAIAQQLRHRSQIS
jgi:4-alpha-glucanotransferase